MEYLLFLLTPRIEGSDQASPAILLAPAIKGLLRHPMRPANLADGLLTPLRLPQNPDDLLFRKPLLLHPESPGSGDANISAGLVFGEQAIPHLASFFMRPDDFP
jgi:hypothetical protein